MVLGFETSQWWIHVMLTFICRVEHLVKLSSVKPPLWFWETLLSFFIDPSSSVSLLCFDLEEAVCIIALFSPLVANLTVSWLCFPEGFLRFIFQSSNITVISHVLISETSRGGLEVSLVWHLAR